MTNKRDNTVTIKSDEMFKLYDINKVQIPNNYTNANMILANLYILSLHNLKAVLKSNND